MARLGDYEGAIALLDNIALETLENNQSLILLRVRYLIEQRLWMRARRSLFKPVGFLFATGLEMAVLYGLSGVKPRRCENRGRTKHRACRDGGRVITMRPLYGRKKLAKGKKRARRGGPPWKRRYKKRLCGRKKAEYIFRHGYALADLDQELALKIVQTYFFEDIRLSARPEVIALFARLQAEKKRRGYRDFVKELSPTDRFTFRSTQYRSCSNCLGSPPGRLTKSIRRRSVASRQFYYFRRY